METPPLEPRDPDATVVDLRSASARWRDAGLIDAGQREAILVYEGGGSGRDGDRTAAHHTVHHAAHHAAQHGAPPAGHAGSPAIGDGSSRRSVGVEAIGYVGGALAVGAIALLVGDAWADLVPGWRVVLAGVVTLILVAAGVALRRAAHPPLLRLSSALLTGSVAGVAWSVTALAGDVLSWRSDDVALAGAAAAMFVAAVHHRIAVTRGLLQGALLASVVAVAVALLERPAVDLEPVWWGGALWVLGGAWFLLGRVGWLPPRRLAEVLGGLLALLALQVAAWSDTPPTLLLTVAVVTAVALVAVAVSTESSHVLIVGALGLFVLVPQLVFELFGDRIGAPATLLVVGLSLVVLAVALGRAHREVADTDPPQVGQPVAPSGEGRG